MRGTFSGVWLPIVTPFAGGEVDTAGYERLVDPIANVDVEVRR